MTGTLYTQTNWIEANTKVGPTNMNKIEQALADSTRLFSGLYSALPAASAAYINKFYYATDKFALFGCFDGAAWTQLTGEPVSVTVPANALFSNGYINYNTSFSYWKDSEGYLHIVGEINDAGTLVKAPNTLIFTFPAGFRPTYRKYFAASNNSSGGTLNRFLINPSGELRIDDNVTANPTTYTNFGHTIIPTFA